MMGKRQKALSLLRRPIQALSRPVRSIGNSRIVKGFTGAAFVAAASLCVRSSEPVHAAVASAPPTKSVDSKKAGTAMSFLMIGGACGFTIYQCAKDQKEEDERIAAENKRLEQLQSDFQVDKSVFKDEDVMASLRKRMAEKKDGGEDGDGSDDDKPGNGGDGGAPPRPPAPSGGGSSAVLEPPSEKPSAPADSPAVGSAADVERLQRMFNLGNDDK